MTTSGADPSWNDCLARSLDTLGVASAQRDLLVRAHADIAREWATMPAYGPMPFDSGVCSDGSPVEVSIRIGRQGQTDARFIAQPFDPGVPADLQAAWAADRTQAFASSWAGPEAAARVVEALRIYPREADPSFSGNFWIWLGLATDAAGQHAGKIYFNPWACGLESRGALALHHLLSCAGMSSDALRQMFPWLAPEIGGMPHIVGWNLVGDRITSVKLYLQGDFDTDTLERMTADPHQPSSNAWTPWIGAAVPMRPHGEVHVALVCRSDSAPVWRLSLLCSDWFRSDADALAALQSLFSQWSVDIWEGIGKLCRQTRRRGRVINFVTVDPEAVTVYLKVG